MFANFPDLLSTPLYQIRSNVNFFLKLTIVKSFVKWKKFVLDSFRFKNDTITGGRCDDFVRGGQNYDLLFGGEGNDQLVGDFSYDILTGEAGNDFFVLRLSTADPSIPEADVIADFTAGQN